MTISTKYWRIKATDSAWATSWGGYYTCIFKLSMFANADLTGTDLALTSTATASSSVYAAEHSAAMAIDTDSSSYWASDGVSGSLQWIQLVLSSPSDIRSAKVVWNSANVGACPKTFELQYSLDNGVTWVAKTASTTPSSAKTLPSYTSDLINLPTDSIATGGSVTTANGYVIHTFNSSGQFVVPTGSTLNANVLVIGGGGSGGGGYYAGGGGGGAMLEQTARQIGAGSYNVVVGAGGAAVSGNSVSGNNGLNSIFDTITAIGGGYGAGYGSSGMAGGAGGSGGGAAAANTNVGGTSTQTNSGGATAYGFKGGNSSNYGGGSGGGAGGVGINAISVYQQTAYGPGRLNSITGSVVEYARGGRGSSTGGAAAAAAVANTGQGGDGADISGGTSSAGAAGIVIIAYLLVAGTVPDAPTNVVASGATATLSSISVSFTAPADGGSPITSYTVTSNDGKTSSGASSPIVVTGLTKGTAYTFTVTATNVIGTGVASNPSTEVSTLNLPDAPIIGSAAITGTGYNSATVSFTPPADNGAPITGYTVTSSVCGLTVSGTTSPLIITGLSYATSYTFTVVAVSANGSGSASAPTNTLTTPSKTFATLDPALKDPSITLSNGNLTATSVSGSWGGLSTATV